MELIQNNGVKFFLIFLNIPVETLEGSELGGLGGAIASQQAIEKTSLEDTIKKDG